MLVYMYFSFDIFFFDMSLNATYTLGYEILKYWPSILQLLDSGFGK